MTLVRTTLTRRRRWERWRTRILSTLHHVHHHEDSTAMTNRCTKSFHILHINQIDRV
jgi:hypothetical protein